MIDEPITFKGKPVVWDQPPAQAKPVMRIIKKEGRRLFRIMGIPQGITGAYARYWRPLGIMVYELETSWVTQVYGSCLFTRETRLVAERTPIPTYHTAWRFS